MIHNAAFDVAFLDAELARLPGERRQLTARCAGCSTRWRWRASCIPASATASTRCASATASTTRARELHGALLDARILADVYLAMTGGQGALALAEADAAARAADGSARLRVPLRTAAPLPVPTASAEELRAHEAMLAIITKASGGRACGRSSDAPRRGRRAGRLRAAALERLKLRNDPHEPAQVPIGVVGLGYVGLPLAVEFGKHFETVGFDIKRGAHRAAASRARPYPRGDAPPS